MNNILIRTQKSSLQQADQDSQELQTKITCLTHQNSKDKLLREQDLNAQNILHSTHKTLNVMKTLKTQRIHDRKRERAL